MHLQSHNNSVKISKANPYLEALLTKIIPNNLCQIKTQVPTRIAISLVLQQTHSEDLEATKIKIPLRVKPLLLYLSLKLQNSMLFKLALFQQVM